ncbi:hypothetical protein FHS55_002125 [Angulomicrobium tetraedrale]|uniref:Uncharacterized protein n=1 Tax=Ancylobacter tetraedralis TaxID=217068 RepID=A0A839Z9W9_9HYPH|nr:hypothetical protein [Ancylobacter tetraedralis]MBB3771526.1 hypothetical protein [Ancylobacter tetraedralis]
MKDLPLSKTYTAGSESFAVIKLRDPGYADYRQIGPVYEVQRGIVIRDREAVFTYVDRLITSPAAGALAVLDLTDTLALEDHILAFFINARTSAPASTNSSSGSDGTPPISTG